MDLLAIVSKSVELEIKHPATGLPIGLTLTLLPPDDPKLTRIARNVTDRANERRLKANVLKQDELEQISINFCIAAVSDWKFSNGLTIGGDPSPECNVENLRHVFTKVPFAREQVDEFMAEKKNFFDV